ncbi:MAG: transcriptional regulator, TetR family [Acidobacteria bacterium]|nr:transcriptional regulator, TetR family [Acidobacteriota bacterium]
MGAASKESIKTQKGELTRALILKAALEIFHERGYEETTMRSIAKHAGVSLGNAYYYFGSKEHLIQAFYHLTHEQHLAALATLPKGTTFKARLLTVIKLKMTTLQPYHEFAGVLFKTAANPQSPLNPFGSDSDPVRRASIDVFKDLVESANVRIPKDLKAELPYLLWLYHMGIVLFWIHDSSPKQRRTYRLIDTTVDLLDKLISLASNPLMRPVRKRALRLIEELREAANDVGGESLAV